MKTKLTKSFQRDLFELNIIFKSIFIEISYSEWLAWDCNLCEHFHTSITYTFSRLPSYPKKATNTWYKYTVSSVWMKNKSLTTSPSPTISIASTMTTSPLSVSSRQSQTVLCRPPPPPQHLLKKNNRKSDILQNCVKNFRQRKFSEGTSRDHFQRKANYKKCLLFFDYLM